MLKFLGVSFIILVILANVYKVNERFNIAIFFFGGWTAVGLVILYAVIRRYWL